MTDTRANDTAMGSTQASGGRHPVVPVGGAALSFTGPVARDDLDDELEVLPPTIGRYHVLARLGAGGMGVVLAAYDPELDRRVAVKLLRGDRSGPDSQIRLLREAQALARLSHPHVVQVHDAGMIGGQVFVAMEFVRGQHLQAWLTAAPRTPAQIVALFLDAGRGLEAAHEAGLVHRDFKPENVLVGDDGRVRVADFGLARPHGGAEAPAPADERPTTALATDLTATGAVLGTPAYMAPEQHAGLVADARSDQYSFCVALWEALYGGRPFASQRFTTAQGAPAGAAPEPPPDATRVPRRLAEILRRGLERDPAARWPDMRALLAALARDPARARRRWLGAAVLSTMVAGTAYGVAEHRASEAGACIGGAEALRGAWDDQRRAALTSALDGARDPELPARVLAGVERYAGAWQVAHRDACLDHRRGEQSSAWLEARMRCLDRRRTALAAAVTVLTTPSAAAPDAARTIAGLPEIADCSDPERALAETAAPTDPALARTGEAVITRLLVAQAEHDAGELARARARAADAAAVARDAGLRPQLAEALLVLGRIDADRDELRGARDELAEAAVHATASGREAIAAEALARQVFLDGTIGKTELALTVAPLARAVAERLPGPGIARARLENNLGAVHMARGETDAALAQFTRATAALAGVADEPLEQSLYWANLALLTREPQAREQALARSGDLLRDGLGPHHLQTLEQRRIHARHAADPRRSADILAELCPLYPRLHPEHTIACGECFHALGNARALLADPAAARAAHDRVPACLHAAPRDSGRAAAQAALAARAAAASRLLADRPAEALAHADAALRHAAPFMQFWWVEAELVDAHLVRARALRALARTAEARETFERAIAILTRLDRQFTFVLPPRWLADARAELAALPPAPPPPPD